MKFNISESLDEALGDSSFLWHTGCPKNINLTYLVEIIVKIKKELKDLRDHLGLEYQEEKTCPRKLRKKDKKESIG